MGVVGQALLPSCREILKIMYFHHRCIYSTSHTKSVLQSVKFNFVNYLTNVFISVSFISTLRYLFFILNLCLEVPEHGYTSD